MELEQVVDIEIYVDGKIDFEKTSISIKNILSKRMRFVDKFSFFKDFVKHLGYLEIQESGGEEWPFYIVGEINYDNTDLTIPKNMIELVLALSITINNNCSALIGNNVFGSTEFLVLNNKQEIYEYLDHIDLYESNNKRDVTKMIYELLPTKYIELL